MSKCPLCGSEAEDLVFAVYCTNSECKNYEAPKEDQSDSSEPDWDSTETPASPWGFPFDPASTAGANPSGSPDDAYRLRGVMYDESQESAADAMLYALQNLSWSSPKPTKPATPNTPLSEVHGGLSEEEQSQLQRLEGLFQTTYADLVNLKGSVEQAIEISSRLGLGETCDKLTDMTFDLVALRAKLRNQGECLGLCVRSLRKQQSGGQRPSESHKSEEQCQRDTALCRACGTNLSIDTPTSFHPAKRMWSGFCSQGCLASSASKSPNQSCESTSLGYQTNLEQNISLVCSHGFQNELERRLPSGYHVDGIHFDERRKQIVLDLRQTGHRDVLAQRFSTRELAAHPAKVRAMFLDWALAVCRDWNK